MSQIFMVKLAWHGVASVGYGAGKLLNKLIKNQTASYKISKPLDRYYRLLS